LAPRKNSIQILWGILFKSNFHCDNWENPMGETSKDADRYKKMGQVNMVVGSVTLMMILQTIGIGAQAGNEWLNRYNVLWTTQSKDSDGSMPCSGGNIGLNVWVENDQILFYIASPDIHDEKGLNIGCYGTGRAGQMVV
jgi:hypothetical protein